MSYSNDQWRSAITNLLKMTSKNEIQWESTQIEIGDAWITVDRSLKAEIKNRIYVISQIRTRYYHDEEEFSWRGGFIFSIFEQKGYGDFEKIAAAPEMNSLGSLFEAAEGNMAFNRNALGGLIG
ncbi:hypothetical protein [Sphingobium sp.]|uniref:hypothetical protein n=1 Tax=Sphingobium TaxID=165695 RepID=UPI001A1C036C|nr:hypothetical protein [Sphingobium sp.]MBJ7378117.1 hypothetical protein [Sphingobium sp.]